MAERVGRLTACLAQLMSLATSAYGPLYPFFVPKTESAIGDRAVAIGLFLFGRTEKQARAKTQVIPVVTF